MAFAYERGAPPPCHPFPCGVWVRVCVCVRTTHSPGVTSGCGGSGSFLSFLMSAVVGYLHFVYLFNMRFCYLFPCSTWRFSSQELHKVWKWTCERVVAVGHVVEEAWWNVTDQRHDQVFVFGGNLSKRNWRNEILIWCFKKFKFLLKNKSEIYKLNLLSKKLLLV